MTVPKADVEQLCAEVARLRAVLRRIVYGVLLLGLAAVVIGIGNVAYTNRVDERRAAASRQVDVARAAAAEQNRLLVCQLATAQADAFQEATTEPGRKSRAAWMAMAARFNCS